MTVGLKVDANIEFGGGVMKPLHSSWSAHSRKLQRLGHIVGAGAIGVGSLDNADLQLLRKACFTGQVANEGRSQSGNLISIKKSETILSVVKVVNDPVSISVERTAALIWTSL